MADIVKQILHKKYTPAEISAGNIASVTTDATTALVIKDVNVAHNDASTTKPLATLSVGTTADLAATPSKFINLGTISSSTTKGASGSEIVDVSSTLSVRVPAQPISFVDTVHSQYAFISTSNVSQVQGSTFAVNGNQELGDSQATITSTTISTTATGAQSYAAPGSHRGLVQNPITGLKLAFAIESRTGSSDRVWIGKYDGTTGYINGSGTTYRLWDFDGRFLIVTHGTTQFKFIDLKGAASRDPNQTVHGYIDLYNKAGDALTRPALSYSYDSHHAAYFSDTGKRVSLISSAYNKELFLVEWPDYTDEPLAWAAPNNKTTGYWLAMNTNNTSTNGTFGPNGNRTSPGYIRATYMSNQQRYQWFIGTSAASKTKRVMVFSNGNNATHANTLYFFYADTDYMKQTNFSASQHAYSIENNDATNDMGWDVNSWGNTANTLWVTASIFRSVTGSTASWSYVSKFYLDQDVLTFTNSEAAGQGPGPIVSWNLKTKEVYAAGGLTWAKYIDSSGNALPNPGAGESGSYPDSTIGHRSFASSPSTTQVTSRTYANAPELEVRITAVEESR